MRDEYDFSEGKRGPVLPPDSNKVRITIRLDADIVQFFKNKVHLEGGGNYQTLINAALRQHIAVGQQPLEETLRRVIREELSRAG